MQEPKRKISIGVSKSDHNAALVSPCSPVKIDKVQWVCKTQLVYYCYDRFNGFVRETKE